jgi:hypothetical protein
MARIDGSNRSVGLTLRRLRPAVAASVLCGASRRDSREAASQCLGRHWMLRRQLSGAAKNAIASRATTLPVRRGSQPRTLHQKHRDSIASDRILYSRCGPRKVREQFAVRASIRGLPRALPQARHKLLPRLKHCPARNRTRRSGTARCPRPLPGPRTCYRTRRAQKTRRVLARGSGSTKRTAIHTRESCLRAARALTAATHR